MAELNVTLCGQTTTIACAPEDEARLTHLIGIIGERAENARAIVGDNDRWRQMLFAAIFLADELDSSEPQEVSNAATMDDGAQAARVAALVGRISAALDRIERAGGGT